MVLASIRRLPSFAAFLLLPALLLALLGCQKKDQPPEGAGPAVLAPSGPPLFEDVTATTGIRFTYHNGEEANHYTMLETLGGGVAVLDYDGDGLLDLFFPGGGHFSGPDNKRIEGYPSKLYRNRGDWKFEDVTAQVGLEQPVFYTHGAAVADYDRDGWPDLLVTGWQRLVLYHNVPVDAKDPKKGRRFVEVSKQAGLPEGLWTTSAAWGDLDGDGYPDLYLCQYVDWSFDKNPPCSYDGKTRDVCSPKGFVGLPSKLYRNDGKGGFHDVSKPAGLRGPRSSSDYEELIGLSSAARDLLRERESEGETHYGKGLGVLLVDVNGDGRPDVYMTNDTDDNYLYMNRTKAAGKPLFEEKGVETGTARDGSGVANGSMGVVCADYDGSGRPSLFVTNFENELHCLYRNHYQDGVEFFELATTTAGLAVVGQQDVSWGCGFADFGHLGWEDLVYVSGHVLRFPKTARRSQPPQLFRNQRDGRFKDVRDQGGAYFQDDHQGRGLALADLDNDGRIDLVISHLNEPVVLLHNVAATWGKHWLGVELQGKDHRDVVGAKVVLEVGGRKQTRFAVGGGSYASSGDRRHVFGLGESARLVTLTVIWPSGKRQTWKDLAIDRYHCLTGSQ